MPSPEPRRSRNRRPGALPGRRFAFTFAAALAAAACSTLAAAACWTAAAAADQTAVVSATIYPSSEGSVSHPSVGLQTLGGCPAYSGSNPLYLYPPGQPYQLTSTAWSLATVLTCGLRLPLSDVTSVQVLNPNLGFEAPLSSADLSDPTRYGDPQAPDALPAISVDGSEDQTTYTRPFRGAGDDNARDQVTENAAPITVVVYEHGPPLTVKPSAQKLASTATATTAKFTATVSTAEGSAIPASALSWSWSFGDGTTSAAATPTHRFPAGSYYVTVQVTDVASGAGGTATIQFTTPASPASGNRNQTGGTKPTKSKSPSGSENGRHSDRSSGTPRAKRPAGGDRGRSTSPLPSPATHPAAANVTSPAGPTAPSAPATPGARITRQPATASRRASRTTTRRAPPPSPSGGFVTGRLVADVVPLPVGLSPLVHVTPTGAAPPPVVRQATRTSSAAAFGSALVVAVLLGLGAWRELRGRRRWRAGPSGR